MTVAFKRLPAPFLYGVCYYPEHWDASRHASDFKRIADAGFDVVRMGEGAWAYWEPKEGHYQFDLFDRAIELADKNGIKVILGTPTYCAPAWVASNYPEVLRWDYQRQPMRHGSRRNFNYTSAKYLELSDKICTALAEHYQHHPSVIAWQLDNEFNCHMDVSYAPSDTLQFRVWLKERYKTIGALNDAWGVKFWSQHYDHFEQVDLPGPTPTWQNPTQLLDELRFISDCVVRFAGRQADILRKFNPAWLITHNGTFANIDLPALGKVLDFYGHDSYPLFSNHWYEAVYGLATARSLSFPFGLIEQQSGPGGQMGYLQRTPRPGEMRQWAWQTIAHGANLLSYFRWRTCPYGAEQHWHGLLDQDDRDNRRLTEAKQVGEELTRLPGDFFTAPPVKAVGILRDYDNESNERRINTYTADGRSEHLRWIAACSRRHVPVDFVWPEGDLTGYTIIVAPHLKIVDQAVVDRLTTFVRGGGSLLLGAQSGLKDRNCHIVEMPLPGLWRELAGVEVEDWTSLAARETREARTGDGKLIAMNSFVERLKPLDATPLAWWTGDDTLLGSAPAITARKLGLGTIYYVGGYSDESAIAEIVNLLSNQIDLKPTAEASGDVEIVDRSDGTHRFICMVNHGRTPQQVTGLPAGSELITGKPIADGTITLDIHGVAILQAS